MNTQTVVIVDVHDGLPNNTLEICVCAHMRPNSNPSKMPLSYRWIIRTQSLLHLLMLSVAIGGLHTVRPLKKFPWFFKVLLLSKIVYAFMLTLFIIITEGLYDMSQRYES